MKKAVGAYHHMLLHTKVGEPALNYLLERGLTTELIEEFKIGFMQMNAHFLQQVFQK